jgi:uncharacterized membrane protein YheB (UPF0754 family)
MKKKVNEKLTVSKTQLRKQAVKAIQDPPKANEPVKVKVSGPEYDKMVKDLEKFLAHLYIKYQNAEISEEIKSEIKKIIGEEIARVKRHLNEVDDSQVPMAYASLEKSKEYSEMIYQKMKESNVQSVDGWIFAKLTLAEDYLKSVFVYLDGRDGLDDTPNTPDDVEK